MRQSVVTVPGRPSQREFALLSILLGLVVVLLLPIQPLHADEAAERLVLATYKLANDASTATGFVVHVQTDNGKKRLLLVTANHVLAQMKGETFSLVSRSRNKDGTFGRLEIEVPIRKGDKMLWQKHSSEDLALLSLPESINVDSLPVDCLPTEEHLKEVFVGDDVRLAVFPERSEANAAGLPVLRSGCIASFPLVPVKPHPMYLVDTTTWTGDSGGPVIHRSLRAPSGGPLVIGIVRGKRRITDTVKESRFVERRTHYPLDLSEVLQAALVREMVEEKKAEFVREVRD